MALVVLSERTLGPARLRLLPKADSLRPVVNLSRPASVRLAPVRREAAQYKSFAPVNKALAPVHAALKCECELAATRAGQNEQTVAEGAAHGSSAEAAASNVTVRAWGEAHARLRAFAARWRAQGRPRVVAVAFDVRKAFDSVRCHVAVRTVVSVLNFRFALCASSAYCSVQRDLHSLGAKPTALCRWSPHKCAVR
jgi:hypothetical protein